VHCIKRIKLHSVLRGVVLISRRSRTVPETHTAIPLLRRSGIHVFRCREAIQRDRQPELPCAYELRLTESNRQPISRFSGNWKANTNAGGSAGSGTRITAPQWIRILSRPFRARCSEAVSKSNRAPSASFDRFCLGYKPFNDAADERRSLPPTAEAEMETFEPTSREFSGEDSKSSNRPVLMIEARCRGSARTCT